MSEHTDKASQKPRKAPAGKRAPRKTRPASARSTGPGRKAGDDTTQHDKTQEKPTKSGQAKPPAAKAETPDDRTANDPAKPMAPDPATVIFGSNRPIVAPPPPKPVSSGLRFSGPSDGVLKSTGPQATSPKAEGLTFSNAGANAGAGMGSDAAETKPATAKAGTAPTAKGREAKSGKTGSAKTKPESTKGKSKPVPGAPPTAKAEPGKAKTGKAKTPGKTSAVTKPAIAPQNHGPLIEKEPSRGPLVLIALGIVTVTLVWWLANQPPSQMASSERDTAGEASSDTGLLPGGSGDRADTAPAPAAPEQAGALITVAELREVRDLLGTIGLDAGAHSDEMTEITRAAIRDYQTMAGLPVDGEATPALLEELRSVAALYGG